ncbi:hypothetical protein EZH24_07215 [Brachyspira catarrhinii]|uniref:Uncharacterized protein n=2 Tax=Brachyspira catarrhinii TaxID=2528966 RepID=A0ABY2TQG5_9SPIR|nr:hypothetical protein EZH24_07215 [Brachyspira catarrhinii]
MILIQTVFSQNEENIMKEAFDRFSKSPFSSIYSTGGAFYSGDDVDQMPMLINYYMNGTSKYLKAVDGLFGSAIMDAQVIRNQMTLNIAEEDAPIKDNFNNFYLEAPIMRFPKVYADILDYKFIDLDKTIVSSNITLGNNWHTLKIEYRDRIDTIVFSASTYRIRNMSIAFMNNLVDITLGSYTTVNNIPYPKEFIIKSSSDKRELRYNITNVLIGNGAKREAGKLGW